MEVKTNKPLTLALTFTALVLGGTLAIFWGTEESKENSVFQSALKYKTNMEAAKSSGIVFRPSASEKKKDRAAETPSQGSRETASTEEEAAVADISTFSRKLDSSQEELAALLPELRKEKKILEKNMRKNGEKIPLVVDLEPELAIVLGTLLDIKPSSIEAYDLEEMDLGSEEWYFLKAFASSGDLPVLLRQNALNKETVNPERLKKLYGSRRHLVETSR